GLREDKAPEEVVREREVSVDDESGKGGAAKDGTAKAAKRRPTKGRTAIDPVEVAGVRITNPDRVLYPDDGFTKADLARYWAAVADAALPLLVGRPLTLVRCPSGIGAKCFFQKHAGDSVPEAVGRVVVPEKTGEPKGDPYMLVDDLSGLISLVQLGVVEFYPWNARSDRLDRPDTIVMDVDPGPGVPWADTVLAATTIRDL